jgi:hypothetical protein
MTMSFRLDDTIDNPSESRIYRLGCGPSDPDPHLILRRTHRVHEQQLPTRILPFLAIGTDSSVARMRVEQIFDDISLDISVKSILQRFGSASSELEFFLRNSVEIAASLEQVLDYLEDSLRTSGVSYDLIGDVWQDLEATSFKVLEVIVKVNVADYEQILKLWRTADEKIYENLKPPIKKKIVVLFERL